MPLFALLSATLPVAAFGACWMAIRPAQPVPGGGRLTTIRAALVVAAYAEVSIELLSLVGWLTAAGVRVMWLTGIVAAVLAIVLRQRRSATPPPWPRPHRPRLGPIEWLMSVGLAGIALGTLVVARAAEPNNWDSQAYHLPKVMQWVARGAVELYPAGYFPQATSNPGAEYLLLHARLLTGDDVLFNLVQWTSGLISVVAVSWIAGQLGAGRFGQLVSALLFAAAPAVVCQATSTQNDLVAAAWASCATVLVLDSAWRRLDARTIVMLGLAVGLSWDTKNTGAIAAFPMMALWFVARAVKVRSRRDGARLVGATLGIVAVTAAIVGPFTARMVVTYHNPFGPPEVTEHTMARHDPASVLLNGARTFQTALLVPSDWVNTRTADAVEDLAHLLNQPIIDNEQTTRASAFPLPVGYVVDEDIASTPTQVVAIGLGLLFCLIWRRRDPKVLAYAATCVVIAVAFCASIRWQWFGNRFLLPWFAVGVPLAGLAADALAGASARRVATGSVRNQLPVLAGRAAVGLVLTGAVLLLNVEGAHAVLAGSPRPLYDGTRSVLTMGDLETRFVRSPAYLPQYEWAVAKIKESGAQRIGLDVEGGLFEYPWWIMLPDRELVQLRSVVPGHPAASPSSVDAIVCFAPPVMEVCSKLVPQGWTLETREYVALALPPTR